MTPPGDEARETGPAARAALSCRITGTPPETVRKRADFLRAAAALRQGTPGFMVQARQRDPSEPAVGLRVGYTCSRKIGNSVIRNRARRRLREVARAVLPARGRPGWDYVLVGRPGATISRDFATMIADLERALARLHAAGGDARAGTAPARGAK